MKSARGRFDTVNKDVNAILDAIEKNAAAFFATKGITLDYIGWAGTLTFDKDVQKAVNDRYTAEKIAAGAADVADQGAARRCGEMERPVAEQRFRAVAGAVGFVE